jgi:hypothetical protein
MGQYYRLTILKKNWKQAKQPVEMSLSSYDFDNGAKLMEFSYLGNSYMHAIEKLLGDEHEGSYAGHPFVCCGDYADPINTRFGEADMYRMACDKIEACKKYVASKPSKLYRHLVREWENESDHLPDYRFIVNESKKEYCIIPKYNPEKWVIHPLSILCCDGNGRGSGDYPMYEEDDNPKKYKKWDCGHVGIWAYDRIRLTNKRPIGYKKIVTRFKIDW